MTHQTPAAGRDTAAVCPEALRASLCYICLSLLSLPMWLRQALDGAVTSSAAPQMAGAHVL